MMYCSKCGKQLNDGDAFCSGCGQPTGVNAAQSTAQSQTVNQAYAGNNQNSYNAGSSYSNQGSSMNGESNALAIVAVICSILLPGIGLILAIIGLCTYKNKNNRNWCTIAVIINIIYIVFGILSVIFGYWTVGIMEDVLTELFKNCAIPG